MNNPCPVCGQGILAGNGHACSKSKWPSNTANQAKRIEELEAALNNLYHVACLIHSRHYLIGAENAGLLLGAIGIAEKTLNKEAL